MAGCGGHAGSALPNTNTTGSQSQTPALRKAHTAGNAAGGSLFVPNSVKYSDNGSHPVTGRSGSAAIQSRALLAKDGTTLVEATTGVIDGAAGAGNIRHVTTTATTFDGAQQPTQAYNNLKAGGYWSHTYSGFARNEALRVDTNVTDLDPRTDVVTTNDTVKLRPDLAASNLTGPAKAYRNHVVSFVATVKEINGDVGAHADCVLSVDGTQVDQAHAIWVDAGGTVSCAFQTSFATLGTKHVSVAVTSVVPADWDTSNNTAQTTIEIVDPIVHLTSWGSATTGSNHYTRSDSYNGYYYRDGSSYDSTQNYSVVNIEGWTSNQGAQFPITQFTGSMTADSNPVALPALGAFFPAYGNCEAAVSPGASANVCAYGWQTEAWVSYYGAVVTYYSNEYACYWGSCWSDTYVNNQTEGVPFTLNFGSSDVFALSFTDANGTQFTGQTAAGTPQNFSYSYSHGGCWGYWWWYNENYCWSESDAEHGTTVTSFGI